MILFEIDPQRLPLFPLKGDGPWAVYVYAVTSRESSKSTETRPTIAAPAEELTERRFWKSRRL